MSNSSLHWNISLLSCLFSYNGVCFNGLKLSVDYVILNYYQHLKIYFKMSVRLDIERDGN